MARRSLPSNGLHTSHEHVVDGDGDDDDENGILYESSASSPTLPLFVVVVVVVVMVVAAASFFFCCYVAEAGTAQPSPAGGLLSTARWMATRLQSKGAVPWSCVASCSVVS